ncbi:hypothetical protein I9X38_07550 [Bacillus mojavensis]|nr:hypothetical protein I9X38_07550 [Bacillus mojavensis]
MSKHLGHKLGNMLLLGKIDVFINHRLSKLVSDPVPFPSAPSGGAGNAQYITEARQNGAADAALAASFCLHNVTSIIYWKS